MVQRDFLTKYLDTKTGTTFIYTRLSTPSTIQSLKIYFIVNCNIFIKKSINCCLGSAHKGLEDVILDEVFDLKMDISKKEGEAITVTYKVIQHHININ